MASDSSFRKNLLNLQSNMMSFAYQLTSDREAAADLLQDTTLKVLDNEDKFTSDSNFKGWVFTIMRNIFINNYRKNVRQATIVDTTDDLYHINTCQESALETPEGSIAVKEITAVINTFEDEFRIPFNMHVAGYKYSEIAEEMDLPVGTVKSRIFFARKRLREALSAYAY
ncbi:MAG: sigma-70 family RNA polymerase sigma factor [Muribaculaceae bacterium]|nr:sigma-70 family RNA polymerase sigma factor [Muribaculaceae bacterium]